MNMYDLKKRVVGLLSVLLLAGTVISVQGKDFSIKGFQEIRIVKNLSLKAAKKSIKQIEAAGYTAILNPKFNCKSVGFWKKDLFASGTMYGTNRKDGGIDISGEGDFKAYTYVRYKKGDKECRETTYTKEYDLDRYGKYTIAMVYKK